MHRLFRVSVLCIIGLILWIIYKHWFLNGDIIGGDWPYYFRETFEKLSFPSTLWTYGRGGGLGGVSPVMNLDTYERFLYYVFVQALRLDFTTVFFYGWFGLFLFLSTLSSYVFSRLLHTDIVLRAVTVLIFLTNTYVLMLVGGGQMGVALAYASAPLMLIYFIRMFQLFCDTKINFKSFSFIFSFLKLIFSVALVVLFDARIAFVVCIALAVYLLISFPEIIVRGRIVKISVTLAGAFILAFGLNSFWFIPENSTKDNPLSDVASSVSLGSVKFFSFADFSHSLALLHPNWPDNIFGKTYFLDSVFLLLPLLAFTVLLGVYRLFRNTKHSAEASPIIKTQVFFAILALIGVFLSKGANAPFGKAYEYLFVHIPGFIMFRDPTKFYLLTILSYAILIPIGIKYVSGFLENLKFLKLIKRYLFSMIVVFFLLTWAYMINPALAGNLRGTFSNHIVPSGYQEFKSILIDDDTFSRTLWVPRQSRFSYYDSNHPPVELSTISLATTSAEFSLEINNSVFQKKLIALGIGYLIVPADPLGELFVEDRKYSRTLRDGYIQVLDSVPWLTKIQNKDLEIYRTQFHNRLFSIVGGGDISSFRKNDAEYETSLSSGRPLKLLFSQSFNNGWALRYNSRVIKPQKTAEGLMVFDIPAVENPTKGIVVFEPDMYRNIGYIVSIISVVIILLLFGINFL